MYKELVDPNFVIRNFTLEEQSKILKAGRSNCTLDATKLSSMYPRSKIQRGGEEMSREDGRS